MNILNFSEFCNTFWITFICSWADSNELSMSTIICLFSLKQIPDYSSWDGVQPCWVVTNFVVSKKHGISYSQLSCFSTGSCFQLLNTFTFNFNTYFHNTYNTLKVCRMQRAEYRKQALYSWEKGHHMWHCPLRDLELQRRCQCWRQEGIYWCESQSLCY